MEDGFLGLIALKNLKYGISHMKKILKAIPIYLVFCLLAGCNLLQSAIFQDESCSPPCWHKITPGQSSPQDVNMALKSIPAVDPKSIKTVYGLQANEGIAFKFYPVYREDAGRIISQSGIVEVINFGLRLNGFKLGDILQEWGSPDEYVSIYYWFVDEPYLATSIIYSHKGIILGAIRDMRPDEVPLFDSGFRIQSIWFINPSFALTSLQNGFIDTLKFPTLQVSLQPWTGYGKIHFMKYH